MRSSLRATLFSLMAFAIFTAGSVLLQQQLILRWRELPYRYRGSLFLPSAQYVRAASLGYDKFLSDFLWIRMIQSFAANFTQPDCAPEMKSYFDVITDLDPQFADVYEFTITAVGDEGRRNDLVKEVIQKAIVQLPGQCKIPFQGAVFALQNMNDPELAKFYVRVAMEDPERPVYVDRWIGAIDQKMGKFSAAAEWYLHQYLMAIRNRDSVSKTISLASMDRVLKDWFREVIRQRVTAWHEERQAYPDSIEQMDQAGAFKGVELPDVARIHGLIARIEQGELTLPPPGDKQEQEIMNLVQQVLRARSWDHLPPNPDDYIQPGLQGWVVSKFYPPEHERFIRTRVEAFRIVRGMVAQSRARAEEYREVHGSYPPDLQSYDPALVAVQEPFGGRWDYDPKTGTVVPSTYPNIMMMNVPGE